MNNVQASIAGNVAQDPEKKEIPGGSKVLQFSVPWQPKKDGPTTWVQVKVWGKQGEALSWLKKGAKVAVHGRLGITSKVNDKGEAKTYVSIDASSVDVLYNPKGDDAPKEKPKADDYPESWDD